MVNSFQRYEQMKGAKNNRKQKTFSALFLKINISDFRLILLDHITYCWKLWKWSTTSGLLMILHYWQRLKKTHKTSVSDVFKFSLQLGLKISLSKTQVQVIGRNSTQINIQLALGAMHILHSIWRAQNITNQSRIALFLSLVLFIILYVAETWELKRRDKNELLSFEMSCLRQILGISRRYKIPKWWYSQITRPGNIYHWQNRRIHINLTYSWYYGHITQMNNNRLPMIIIDGSKKGSGTRGRPQKQWTDGCKESCQAKRLVSLTEVRRPT